MIAIYNGEQFECGIDGEKIILYSNNQQDGFERSIARYKKVVNRKDCERVLFRDRSHPIDTVMLNDFNRKSGTDIETVKLEYGPSANEYTRSHHALAIAVANTIYFRNGAYKPETEEGKKLLAHELTHIAQNKEKEDYRNKSVDEKEKEAEIAEKNEEYKSDRLMMRKIKGKEYLFKESIWKMIDYEAKQKLEEKIESLENCLAEEEYLRLLINYREWGKE